jgi:hypothetical protein
MDKQVFTKYLEQELTKLIEVNKKASIEYTNNDDAFDNFKRIGALLDISPEKVLAVYLIKHFDAIIKYCKGNEQLREPISGRIEDLQLYAGLLKGMWFEKQPLSPQQQFQNDMQNIREPYRSGERHRDS